jgi:hypothetical protein
LITYKVKFVLLALLMLQVFFSDTASSQTSRVIQIRDNILSAGDQRVEAIEEIDKLQLKMEDQISLYMELLNYYIGEATTGILCEQITRMGDKILPSLIEKKNSPVKCEEKYKSICLTMEERNGVLIDRLIRSIKEGTILYYEYPRNLRKEVEGSMKIIKIFLKDFKKQKGNFPKDLNALREYGWNQYGYKLVIVTPWGEPFKYLLKGTDKYILDYDSPEKEAAKSDMEKIIIFLERFKKEKGSFPQDLNVLKEYALKHSGYELTIMDPWGQPFKYLPQGKNKYILEIQAQHREE